MFCTINGYAKLPHDFITKMLPSIQNKTQTKHKSAMIINLLIIKIIETIKMESLSIKQ